MCRFFTYANLRPYLHLMRVDRPIGTLLLLWPTLWALFLAADGMPRWNILVIFVLGVIVMRAAGCVINDYADRNIDGNVKRTTFRPLPTGEVTPHAAKWLFAGLIFIAFLLVCFLDPMTQVLSVIALLLAFIYPFMKRYTHLPQVVLGCAFGWAIPMAFSATVQSLPLSCWLLFAGNLAWTVAYDTQYAMVDRDDDLRIGVKSTAILFGKNDNLIIRLLQGFFLLMLYAVGVSAKLSPLYFVMVSGVVAFFLYQAKLTKKRQRNGCFQAFLNNNYVGGWVFFALLLGIFC